jgi:hypothetical protein
MSLTLSLCSRCPKSHHNSVLSRPSFLSPVLQDRETFHGRVLLPIYHPYLTLQSDDEDGDLH